MKIIDCKHLPKKFAKPRAEKCEENHFCPFGIRVCLTCGHVGCCDSCPGQHARSHAKKTGHQVMAYYPASEDSPIWCYADDDYLEPNETINVTTRR